MNLTSTPNRLINEKSPYLLQHAHNPVDWFPWGEEVFQKAKAEDKPIFLSIGYSTCHWCHVMERESFEDEEVAEILNNNFVSIKVDREERPDIDSIYMTFCQAYSGSGGWPLTIIMTSDKKPFFAGTYFPKESKYGRPGIKELLNSIHNIWIEDKEKLISSSEDMLKQVKKFSEGSTGDEMEQEFIDQAVRSLKGSFEKSFGGFSEAPKFPTPHNLYFLLRYCKMNKDTELLNMVEKTLTAMYNGGIFDHIGFGFSRYSTDKRWLVPHFEKMLYDNALLSLVYTECYKFTGKSLYKEIAEKTYTYILRDMKDEKGGFYSAEDADSEGEEGKFYVWDLEEMEKVLGKEKGKLYSHIYDITQNGNFEGKNIPNLIGYDIASIENNHQLKEELEGLRKKLYEYREKREHPFKDDKVLTSWNGLMIASLAYSGRILEKEEYINAAKQAAKFIFENLINNDGIIASRYRHGQVANKGILDDYAFFIWGLIELYQSTLDTKYLKEAVRLNKVMIELFKDEENGGFYLYGSHGEELIMRPKELYDGALPSGNSVAALNLFRLWKLTGDESLEKILEGQFKFFGGTVKNNPYAYTLFITAFMYSVSSVKEIVITGNKEDKFVIEALKVLNSKYEPFSLLLLNDESKDINNLNPFLKNQGKIRGENAVYICENFSCKEPIVNIEKLKETYF